MPLTSNNFRFGLFSLDVHSAELHNNGTKSKLPEQPFQVLTALLEHAGEVVTREELRQRLWPADTFVDFDHSLNAAVKRLREALGDSADTPRFIETLPRHGYRFIGVVDKPNAERSRPGGPGFLLTARKKWLVIALLVVVCVIGLWRVFRKKAGPALPPREPVRVAVYHGNAFQPALSPDGDRIVFVAGEGSDLGIYSALVGGEKSVRLTNNPRDAFPKWSPDGQQIAFYRFSDYGLGIYTIPALGGTEHRVFDGPSSRWEDAGLDWSPDGESLAITEYEKDKIHSHIAFLSLSDFTTRPLTFPDSTRSDCNPTYSPNGSLIIFTRYNVSGTTSDMFVVPVTGGEPRRISDLRGKSKYSAAWTPDGKEIIVVSNWAGAGGSSSIWAGAGESTLWRVPLSGGTPTPVAGVGAGGLPVNRAARTSTGVPEYRHKTEYLAHRSERRKTSSRSAHTLSFREGQQDAPAFFQRWEENRIRIRPSGMVGDLGV